MNSTMRLVAAIAVLSVISMLGTSTQAQGKKGDKEVFFLAGNTSIGVGDTTGNVSFGASGLLGYYLTNRNEIGGGTSFYVARYKLCSRLIDENGKVVSQDCYSDTTGGIGFSAFYRYNISRESSKHVPFVGAQIAVADVAHNYTGNWRARPFVGYKYFLSKNIGLDFSFGYSVDLNRDRRDFSFDSRQGNLDGQVGLTFVF